jgi:hypothetical protein
MIQTLKLAINLRRGGMGFRNFTDFNQALLAKHSWRLLTNPESLCSRVLRARYFSRGDFLGAQCPSGTSYTWRSIIHGMDLFKEGMIWRVGDGTNIDIWRSNWIPQDGLKRPLGHMPGMEVVRVQELLLPDGRGWDVGKRNDCFFEWDVADILKIPVGRAGTAGTDDYIA